MAKYKTTHIIKQLSAEDYAKDYRDPERFLPFCEECAKYAKVWSCPPFDRETAESTGCYRYITLIGTRIMVAAADDENENCDVPTEGRRILSEVREKLDRSLLEMEKEYPGSRAFYAGSCMICTEECARVSGKRCRNSDKMRNSLESIGFDMEATASELLGIEIQWGTKNKFPEYYMLVSGIFTATVPELPERFFLKV